MTSMPLLADGETILDITSLPLPVDRPRAIDDIIDYFGDPPRTRDLRRPRAVDVAGGC